VALLVLALLIAGCGSAASSPAPTFGDVQRVWCGAHPVAAVNAGTSLGVAPSRFVVHKAQVEQASLDGDSDKATSLILAWVGQEMTATDSDPHPNVESMPSWEADSAADMARACMAAWEAGKDG
jgi:hypothetical protein